MIKIYQKQPIQAEQFDGSQKYIFGHKVISDNSLVDALTHDPVYYSILINEDDSDDPEEEPNEVVFEIGDWIMLEKEYFEVIDKETFGKLYDALPVIPEAVSKTLIYAKNNKRNLSWVIMQTPNDLMKLSVITKSERQRFSTFFRTSGSNDTFARAWLDGYQVEEDV